jgi:hypothetical protein
VKKIFKRKKKRKNNKDKNLESLEKKEKSKEELYPAKILGETSDDGASIT